MADVDKKKNEVSEDEQISSEKKFSMIKVGIPVFIIQVALAFVLANYVLVPMIYSNPINPEELNGTQLADAEQESPQEFGEIYAVEEVVVNPAGSNGLQFVLINFGFEVKSSSDKKILEDRQVQVRDNLINILGRRTLEQLDGADDKESLREEVKETIGKILPEGSLLNVYFSNYIIQ